MNFVSTYQAQADQVRVCNRNFCIEAKGENAKMIAGAFAFMLVCIGIAALAKAA